MSENIYEILFLNYVYNIKLLKYFNDNNIYYENNPYILNMYLPLLIYSQLFYNINKKSNFQNLNEKKLLIYLLNIIKNRLNVLQ